MDYNNSGRSPVPHGYGDGTATDDGSEGTEMTLEACYEALGGDLTEVLERLDSEKLIRKYLLRVPGDGSYKNLEDAMRRRAPVEASLAAHTLKGFALTLGLPGLADVAGRLSDALRGENGEDPELLYEALKARYCETVEVISRLDRQD